MKEENTPILMGTQLLNGKINARENNMLILGTVGEGMGFRFKQEALKSLQNARINAKNQVN